MKTLKQRIGSIVLVFAVIAVAGGLATWKAGSIKEANAASANQPEPMELVTSAVADEREHRETTTAIGTVLAMRSVTLRNELSGTVREVKLSPGQIVETGAVLVALDVSVEEAELRAHEAQAALAESVLQRAQRLNQDRATTQTDLDRARADREIALAQVARTRAIIARKTIRAPFRARVGITDIHPGQYLNDCTPLTTLQGVDQAVHVDFTVAQDVAGRLRTGDHVQVFVSNEVSPRNARVIAIDARVDPTTRNAVVRATLPAAGNVAPGAAVRVVVPAGPQTRAVAIPVSALRKGPQGDHVFVITQGQDGKTRATARPVVSGAVLGDEVLIHRGLEPGESVAASGSFKLRDGVLVSTATASAKQ